MSYHIHQGLNHVSSYQMSGVPFIYSATASTTPVTVEFPTVSKVIYIENLGGSIDLKVTFPSSPSSTITIPAGDKIEMPIKAGAVKVETASSNTTYQIYASLTTISRDRIEGIVI